MVGWYVNAEEKRGGPLCSELYAESKLLLSVGDIAYSTNVFNIFNLYLRKLMQKIFFILSIFFLSITQAQTPGEWTWIKGDSIYASLGNFGVQGVPSPSNNPPSSYEACEWTDSNGNFWVFGGWGQSGDYNSDLWKYDPLVNEWTWVKGIAQLNDTGDFGIQGVSSISNRPSGRGYGVMTWADNQNNLWMFGGAVFSPDGFQCDLWKYNIGTNEWTWMKGPKTADQNGVYGLQGIPDSLNYPRGRSENAATWIDNSNNLWLFGGGSGTPWIPFSCNDVWMYSIASNEWTWMKGSQNGNPIGVYGTLGVEDFMNTPNGRSTYCRWKDSNDNFWLFGGLNWGVSNPPPVYNDIWKYNPSTNNWTWMGGSNLINSQTNYGEKCIFSNSNILGPRIENRASWVDDNYNFWHFGGGDTTGTMRHNDLWMYCPSSNKWIWVNGDTINGSGHWGTMGVSNPLNIPEGRMGSNSFKDNNGNLYLFGGYMYNDLWRYTINDSCSYCGEDVGLNDYKETEEIILSPSPCLSALTVKLVNISQSYMIAIYNILGNEVYSGESLNRVVEIDVRLLSPGIYFLQVQTEKGSIVKKFIKE
jgi:hypothetical protein